MIKTEHVAALVLLDAWPDGHTIGALDRATVRLTGRLLCDKMGLKHDRDLTVDQAREFLTHARSNTSVTSFFVQEAQKLADEVARGDISLSISLTKGNIYTGLWLDEITKLTIDPELYAAILARVVDACPLQDAELPVALTDVPQVEGSLRVQWGPHIAEVIRQTKADLAHAAEMN